MTLRGDFGKAHVITGPGKGKTTAAFGLAIRAAGHGYRACVIQFMKAGEVTGELLFTRDMDEIEVVRFGTGSFVDPSSPTEEDRRAARSALAEAKDWFVEGECELVILDEVNTAVAFGLISPKEVLDLLRSRPKGVEVVLTGRDAPPELIEYADYVSVIEDLKHPFDSGCKARKGIEY